MLVRDKNNDCAVGTNDKSGLLAYKDCNELIIRFILSGFRNRSSRNRHVNGSISFRPQRSIFKYMRGH